MIENEKVWTLLKNKAMSLSNALPINGKFLVDFYILCVSKWNHKASFTHSRQNPLCVNEIKGIIYT